MKSYSAIASSQKLQTVLYILYIFDAVFCAYLIMHKAAYSYLHQVFSTLADNSIGILYSCLGLMMFSFALWFYSIHGFGIVCTFTAATLGVYTSIGILKCEHFNACTDSHVYSIGDQNQQLSKNRMINTNSTRWIHIGASWVMILLAILCKVFFTVNMVDVNPLSYHPLSVFNNHYLLLRRLSRVVMVLLFQILLGILQVLEGSLVLLNLGIVYIRLSRPSDPRNGVSLLSNGIDWLLLYLSLAGFVMSAIGTESGGGNSYWIFGILTVILLVFTSTWWERRRLIGYVPIINDEYNGCMLNVKYFYSLIILADRCEKNIWRQRFHGSIKNLYDWQNRLRILPIEVIEQMEYVLKWTSFGSAQLNKVVYKEEAFRFIGKLGKWAVSVNQRDWYSKYMLACVLNQKLDLRWQAVYILKDLVASSCPCGRQIKNSSMNSLELIQSEVAKKEVLTMQVIGIDGSLILKIQKYMEKLKGLLNESTETAIQFWSEMLSRRPNGSKLQKLGFKIANLNDSIIRVFREASESELNQNIGLLNFYGNYLRLVVNDTEESKKILSKAASLQLSLMSGRSFLDQNPLKNIENGNPSLVVAQATVQNMGKIISANAECLRLLEYLNSEVVGEDINQLMPKVYSNYHLKWMLRYFELGKENIIDKGRRVLARSKRGYLIAIELLIKVVPDIISGLQIMGIFVKHPQIADNSIIVDGNTGEILGVGEHIQKNYGISPAFCYDRYHQRGSGINIRAIFPKLDKLENLRNSYFYTGELELNTTDLESLHSTYKSEGLSTFNRLTPTVFSSYKVKGTLISKSSHGEEDLCILEIEIKQPRPVIENVKAFHDGPKHNLKEHKRNREFVKDLSMILEDNWENDASRKNNQLKLDAKKSNENSIKVGNDKRISVKAMFGKSKDESQNHNTSIILEDNDRGADRERRVKEYKQILKNKTTPLQVKLARVAAGFMTLGAVMVHILILLLKFRLSAKKLDAIVTEEGLNQRNILLVDVAYQVMKIDNIMR